MGDPWPWPGHGIITEEMELICRVAAYLNNGMQLTALRAAADAEAVRPPADGRANGSAGEPPRRPVRLLVACRVK